MTTRQLIKEISAELQSMGILASEAQALGFLKAWQDENEDVIECLADCVSNRPEWLYGWLLSGETLDRNNFTWLKFLIIENRPSLAEDHFSIWRETEFELCATV